MPKIKYNKLAHRLKNRRLELGLTQKDVALALKLKTPQDVSNWERASAPIPPHYFKQLSKLLRMHLRVFIVLRVKDYKQELLEVLK